MENKNNDKINYDKFIAHKGEFIPVTADFYKDKKVTMYEEFIEEDEEGIDDKKS